MSEQRSDIQMVVTTVEPMGKKEELQLVVQKEHLKAHYLAKQTDHKRADHLEQL